MAGKTPLIIGIVVPLLLGAGIFGAAKMGMVNIPGITAKKKALAAKSYTEDKDKLLAKANEAKKKETPKPPPAEEKPKPKPITKIDPKVGQQQVADVWSEMDAAKIAAIVKDWNDKDLAGVLVLMDQAKTAEVLAALEPVRASKLSKEIQKAASVVAIK